MNASTATSNHERNETSLHVLVVDDDKDIAHSLRDLFEIQYDDAMVEVANNVESAHKHIRKHSPDIVLIDIKLGNENGLDLVPFIKHSHPGAACIMMTAFRDTEYAIKALRIGADDYILKPIDPLKLFRIVDVVVNQKKLEQEKSDLEKRFKTLFEKSADLHCIVDGTGAIIDVNQTATTTTCSEKELLLGSYLVNASWWENSVLAKEQLNSAISNALKGYASNTELELNLPDAQHHTFDFSIKPVPDTYNNVSLILIEGRDISARKQYERKIFNLNTDLEKRVKERTIALERASNAKSEFLSRMSHELRTPLNIILGYAQILEIHGNESLNEDQQECISEIHSAGDHLLELVNDVLDLTRAEQNKLVVNIAPLNLPEAIREASKMLCRTAEQKNKSLTISSDIDINVLADKTRLRQILVNLTNNALKYGGNVIDIGYTTNSDGYVRINVSDDGPGIEESKQALLFVPFERLGAEYECDGTGIGLTICEHLVHLMKGHIGVDSTPGEGTTFWFELPLANPE